MKVIFKILLLLLTRILVGQATPYSYSYSSTVVGDVRIQTLQNGSLYCDSMICPDGSVSCIVTKRNDPNNIQVIVRHRSCLDVNGDIVREQVVYEDNINGGNVNMQVVSGGGGSHFGTGRQMTPQEQRDLEEYFRQQQQRFHEQMTGAMNQLQFYISPFLDGSFAANLNNRIRSNMRNLYF